MRQVMRKTRETNQNKEMMRILRKKMRMMILRKSQLTDLLLTLN
jgi:hypothetical protein